MYKINIIYNNIESQSLAYNPVTHMRKKKMSDQ